MASKRKRKREPLLGDLSPQARQAIGAVAVGVLGIFFVLSSFGGTEANMAGPAGKLAHIALTYLLGVGFILAPVTCALYVYILMRPRDNGTINTVRIVGIFLLLLSILGLLALYDTDRSLGGLVGTLIAKPLSWLLGSIATTITLTAALFIAIFLTFNTGIGLSRLFGKKAQLPEEDDEEEVLDEPLPEEIPEEDVHEEPEEDVDDVPEDEAPKKKGGIMAGFGKQAFAVSSFSGPYAAPPLSLLERDKGKARVGDTKANTNIIKRTLQRFNIQVEMDEVSVGPSVTRYTLKPAEGTRIAKIVGLQKELELALAAHPVRIEAPIPGKSLVGIEVPNAAKSMVGMASLLSAPEYTDSPKPLLVTLGKDIAGVTHFANVAKMPHLLIAGSTGSGKSVMIHSLITSLLFRNSPDQMRFIMIDPKRVELTFYSGIPHLLTPVITDAKKAILSLKWAAKEMERRYEILEGEKVRDISSYHDNIYQPARAAAEKRGKKADEEEEDEMPEPLPYIVIIIDELADIMQAYPRELESSIVRLAQKSRAVGIHLILSTQRPEVKVITGLIKANVPTRIALKVASQIDSRTILDQPGAEKLLGYGDMLFLSSEMSKPLRIQGAFISEAEIKGVAQYLKKQPEAQELDTLDFSEDNNKENSDAFFESMTEDEDDDDLYEEARDIVMKAGKASTSYLQRRLRIGYSRAARLVDMLEERGVIGAQDGSRPREVLGRSEGAATEEET